MSVIPRVLVFIFVIASLLVASTLSYWLGERPIDVGLDVSSPNVIDAPRLVLKNSNKSIGVMSRIPDRFAPALTRFDIVATGSHNPASRGYEIRVATRPETSLLQRAEFSPPHFWHVDSEGAFAFGDYPSRIHYEAMGGPVTLEYQRQLSGGHVLTKARNVEQILDLYSENESSHTLTLPLERWGRFHARIPGKYAGKFDIQFPDGESLSIERLCISTLYPHILFTNRAYPHGRWGNVISNWNPKIENDRVFVPPFYTLESVRWQTWFALVLISFAIFNVAAIAAIAAVRCVAQLDRLSEFKECNLRSFSWQWTLLFFCALLGVFSIYFAMYFPGIENGDARVQLEEAQSMELHDNHPVLHTLLIKLLRLIWDSWAPVSIFQLTSLALVLSLAFALLVRIHVPWIIVVSVFLVTVLSPRIGAMSVSIWKDVPYAVLVLSLTLLLAWFMVDTKIRSRLSYAIVLGVVLGSIPLIRHNGISLLAVMTPGLFVAFAPRWRLATLSLAVAWSLFFAMKFFVISPLLAPDYVGGASPDFWAKSSTLRNIRHVLAADPPLDAETYSYFEETGILGSEDNVLLYATDKFAAYDSARAYRFKTKVDQLHALNDVQARVWSVLAAAPLLTVRCLVWEDRAWRAQFLFGRSDRIRWGFWVPMKRTYDFAGKWDDRLHERLVALRDNQGIVYSQPVVPFYLVTLASVVCWRRVRDHRVLMVYLPAILNSVVVVIVGASTSDRYHFPLELSAGFLFAFAFMRRIPAENKPTHTQADSQEAGR